MREVVIVGAARTPIGSFLGALALAARARARRRRRSTRRSPAPRSGADAGGRGLHGQRAARPASARRRRARRPSSPASRTSCRHHGQQGVRLGPQGGDARRAGDRARRRRDRGRGRHGVDVERALLPAQGARAGCRMGNAQLRRRDDPRRPVGPVQQLPHGQLRPSSARASTKIAREAQDEFAARASARARRAEGGHASRPRSSPVEVPQKKGDAIASTRDEEPAARRRREVRRAQARVPEGRHDHRRQRLVDQRRRQRARADAARGGRSSTSSSRSRASSATAARAGAGVVHHRAGGAIETRARKLELAATRHRSLRDQRGVRGGGDAPSTSSLGLDAQKRQRARRRRRARPPDRRLRRAHPHHAALRDEGRATRSAACATLCIGGGEALALVVER